MEISLEISNFQPEQKLLVEFSNNMMYDAKFQFESIIYPGMIWVKFDCRKNEIHQVLATNCMNPETKMPSRKRKIPQFYKPGTDSMERITSINVDTFDDANLPTNITTLTQNEINTRTALNNYRFDNLIDHDFELMNAGQLVDFDTLLETFGDGSENKPKMSFEWLIKQKKITVHDNGRCPICQQEIIVSLKVYDLRCAKDKNGEDILHPYHCECLEQYIRDYGGTTCPICNHSWLNDKNIIPVKGELL